MSPRPPGWRPRISPDKARHHAEVSDLERITGVWSLRDVVTQACRGARAWKELLQMLREARDRLPKNRAGLGACVRVLSALMAVNRVQGAGYRGVIASLDLWAEKVEEITGAFGRGCSKSTIRSALAILAEAGFIELGIAGRGVAVETSRGLRRKQVLTITLTQVATSFWSGPRRSELRSSPLSPPGTTPPKIGANGSDDEGGFAPSCDARAPVDVRSRTQRNKSEESPGFRPGDKWTRPRSALKPPGTIEHEHCFASGEPGTAPTGAEASRERPPPARRYSWRPRPEEPENWGNASRAVLYDVETVLIRTGKAPDERDRILRQVRSELAPVHRFEAVAEGRTFEPFSGVPWDDLIWRWRDMPIEDRRVVCRRSILPAIGGVIRRRDLQEIPRDKTCSSFGPWHRKKRKSSGSTALARAPSPRARPPDPVPPEAPKTNFENFAETLPPWLAEALRKRRE